MTRLPASHELTPELEAEFDAAVDQGYATYDQLFEQHQIAQPELADLTAQHIQDRLASQAVAEVVQLPTAVAQPLADDPQSRREAARRRAHDYYAREFGLGQPLGRIIQEAHRRRGA